MQLDFFSSGARPASGCRLDAGDRSSILEPDPQGEIVAIDAERDVDIHRVHIRTPDQKAPDLATGEDGRRMALQTLWAAGLKFCPHGRACFRCRHFRRE
jgi:hypothetical protein